MHSPKAVVLYGAFDRYNYGDLLMPVLFDLFLRRYAPKVFEEFRVIYAAMTSANLAQAGGGNPVAIIDCLSGMGRDSVLVAVGGAVIGATAEAQARFREVSAQDQARPQGPGDPASRGDSSQFQFGGSYPYTPCPSLFPNQTSVLYNAVGSKMRNGKPAISEDCYQRLSRASYLSVRDREVFDALNARDDLPEVRLTPDSVAALTEFVDEEFLARRIRLSRVGDLPRRFFVVQAAPHKLGHDVGDVAAAIRIVAARMNATAVLLPVGYARGHDDSIILEDLGAAIGEAAVMKGNLNIWEIAFVIKHSLGVLATSLHAVITAMAYGRPYLGISEKIPKLSAYLGTWALEPYSRPMIALDPELIVDLMMTADRSALADSAAELARLAIQNNCELVACLGVTVSEGVR